MRLEFRAASNNFKKKHTRVAFMTYVRRLARERSVNSPVSRVRSYAPSVFGSPFQSLRSGPCPKARRRAARRAPQETLPTTGMGLASGQSWHNLRVVIFSCKLCSANQRKTGGKGVMWQVCNTGLIGKTYTSVRTQDTEQRTRGYLCWSLQGGCDTFNANVSRASRH